MSGGSISRKFIQSRNELYYSSRFVIVEQVRLVDGEITSTENSGTYNEKERL